MPTKTFPILYHLGKGGKMYTWEVSAVDDTVVVVTGTANGLKTTTSKRVEQKNKGKKNETSLQEQAILEAQSQWQNKRDRKYRETEEDARQILPLPMLAKEFEKEKKKIDWSKWVHVQPKLDGCRCIASWVNGKISLTSRNGKPWNTVPHIAQQLEKVLPDDCEFDGELYLHGKSFQEITRLIKKQRPETVEVEYHIYDMPVVNGEDELPWSKRLESLIVTLLQSKTFEHGIVPNLKFVHTTTATRDREIMQLHDEFVESGYEGAIVRTPYGQYLHGYRSSDLLKVKKFDDSEFEVVAHKSGKGRYENAVCWTCITPNGKTFDVNPKLSITEKEEYLKEASSYHSKMLKVRYFGLSEDGIPRFPVGIGFRIPEDM